MIFLGGGEGFYFLPQKRKFESLRKSISLLCVIPISTNKQEHFLTQLNVPATKLCVCNSTYCMLTIIKKYVNHLCKPFIESSFTIFTVFVPHFCHLLWEMFSTLRDSFFLYSLHENKTSIILLVLQFKRQNVHSAVFEPPTPQVYGTDFTQTTLLLSVSALTTSQTQNLGLLQQVVQNFQLYFSVFHNSSTNNALKEFWWEADRNEDIIQLK